MLQPEPLSTTSNRVIAAGHCLKVQTISGAAGEPVLVFLHEGLGSILQWREVPQRLAAATGLAALVYDRWGFGGSDRLALPRPDDYLDIEAGTALPDLLRACRVDRHILIGHSDGATIGLLAAARRPPGLIGVVAIAAHVIIESCTVAGVANAAEAWRTTDLPRRLARYHGDKAESVFRGWAETWQRPSMQRWQMLDRLPAIACPTLVIQGEQDEYGSPAQVHAIAASVSGPVETLLLPGCGHAPHLEAAEIVLPSIVRFVERLAPGPTRTG